MVNRGSKEPACWHSKGNTEPKVEVFSTILHKRGGSDHGASCAAKSAAERPSTSGVHRWARWALGCERTVPAFPSRAPQASFVRRASGELLPERLPRVEEDAVEYAEDGEGAANDGAERDEQLDQRRVRQRDLHLQSTQRATAPLHVQPPRAGLRVHHSVLGEALKERLRDCRAEAQPKGKRCQMTVPPPPPLRCSLAPIFPLLLHQNRAWIGETS
eukprot:6211716-Pleurochrysis_carterae.AAC.3